MTARNCVAAALSSGFLAGTLFAIGCGGGVKTRGGTDTNIPPSTVSVYSTAYNVVRVQFSEKVDPATATDPSNYAIEGLTVSGAALDPTGNVVRLTTGIQRTQLYDITVKKSIKDLAGLGMAADYVGSFQGAVEEPHLANATAVKVNRILAEYSENVDSAAGFSGSYRIHPYLAIEGVEYPYGGDSKLALIAVSGEMNDTSYTLEVVGDVKDSDGYGMHPYYGEVSFQGDARPRVKSANSASIRSVRLRFTEPVEETSAESTGNYVVSRVGGGPLAVSSVERGAADPSIVLLTFAADQVQNANYKVVINGVEDLNGNTVSPDTTGYFIGNGPPGIASAAAGGPNRVVVTFTEPVRESDDTQTLWASNYSIGGLSVTVAAWPAGQPGDRTVVWLSTSTQLQTVYTVVLVPGVLHAADDDTAIESGSNSASFLGDGLPTVSSAVALDPTHVKVVFSEPVDQTTSQNTANYSISGFGSLSVLGADRGAEPFTNEVVLTTTTQLYTNYTVTVRGVKDAAGNAIAESNSAVFAGMGVDNTPPNIISVAANSATSIRVYFNEPVDAASSQTAGNYAVSTPASASLAVSGQPGIGESLTVSVADSITGLDSVTVYAADAQYLPSCEFKRNGSSNAVIAYSIVCTLNYNPASPVKAYLSGNTIVLVSKTFGSNGDISIANGLSNVAVASNVAAVSYNPIADPNGARRSAGNYAQVDLLFNALASGVYELSVVNVADTNPVPNVIPPGSPVRAKVVVRGSDSIPPKLAGSYAPDSTHIALLFDEPVDFLTSKEKSNFAIEREIARFTVNNGSSNGNTLTVTYDGGSTYVITAANDENIEMNQFAKGNATATAVNAARVLNRAASSPVYAHAEGTTVYLARRTAGSGTIENVTSSGFGTSGFTRTAADYTNNRTITTSVRNDEFPREVILTLDISTPLVTTRSYGVTATGIADISLTTNTGYGGTRTALPISAENGAPPSDTTPPSPVSAQALSDGLVRLIFNETVDEASAETVGNYSIQSPNLSVNSAVRDPVNTNTVLLYTDLQAALTYTITVNGVRDQSGNPSYGAAASFTGMAAVSVENGPVGNSINGIGNLENKAITAMTVFGNRLYVATLNSGSGEFLTEVHRSDPTGVYFTQANNSGFAPPTQYTKQRQTSSLAVLDGKLWASTSDTPSEKSNVLYTDGASTPIHSWTWDTQSTSWGNTTTRLFAHGIATSRLYVIAGSNLYYRAGNDSYPLVSGSWDGGAPTAMASFGGRLYMGCSHPTTGMKVYRSTGANADFPQGPSDFEKVLDAKNDESTGRIGMNGYDPDDDLDDGHLSDGSNTSVASIAVFKGSIYIGTVNANGAQVWRSADGLTWERALDFGNGAQFGGLSDSYNRRITSLHASGNYLYAGTRNTATGAEVWRSPDGIAWEQFGSDGFGSASYTDVNAIGTFLGLVYFGMEDSTSGGAIFRANN